MSTVRTPIVDKNGKATHVNKKVDTGSSANGRLASVTSPPKSKPQSAPGLREDAPRNNEAWNPDAYVDSSYPTFSTIIEPATRSETVKALSDPSGRKSKGEVRWVELTWRNTDTSRVRDTSTVSKYSLPMSERADTFNIVPPTDGTPMIIRNHSGHNNLNIESGNAVINLTSSSCPLRIAGDANVVVILGDGKYSIDVADDAKVQIVPSVGSWGSVRLDKDSNAEIDVKDYLATPEQHKFRNLSIPVDYDELAREKADKVASNDEAMNAWMEAKSANK